MLKDDQGPSPFCQLHVHLVAKLSSQRISIDAWRLLVVRLLIDTWRRPVVRLSKVGEYQSLKMTRWGYRRVLRISIQGALPPLSVHCIWWRCYQRLENMLKDDQALDWHNLERSDTWRWSIQLSRSPGTIWRISCMLPLDQVNPHLFSVTT